MIILMSINPLYNKPKSSKQKYRLTPLGQAIRTQSNEGKYEQTHKGPVTCLGQTFDHTVIVT